MVDLPTIPDTVPQIKAPTPAVSASDIAQPYKELAATLSSASEFLSRDVAVPFAKQAGYQAVQRDAEGNLQVTKAPIFGDAAIAFNDAVKFSALAQGDAEAKRADLALSKQYHQDPDGYLKAAQAFRDQHVKDYTGRFGPEVGINLGKAIDNQTTYNYRYLLNEQQRNIKQNFDRDTRAKAASLDADIIAGIQTADPSKPLPPDIQAKIDERHAVTLTRVTNPILNASTEETRLDLKDFDAKVTAAQFTGRINATIKEKGVDAAQRTLDAMANDTTISPTQRMVNYSFGAQAIGDHIKALDRQATLNNKIQKDTDKLFEDAVIRDSASGQPPRITENDVKTNTQASPEARMRMLGWMRRDGMPEPLARVSQATSMDLFRRMNLDEGDPGKITDLRPIRDAYVAGTMTRQDEEWLEKRFNESRSPDGTKLNQMRNQLTKASGLDKSTLMSHDDSGKQAQYRFEQYVDQRIDDYRKAGKNPIALFAPGNPDFLGKPETIHYFRATMEEQMKSLQQRFSNTKLAPPPGLIPESAVLPSTAPQPVTRRQPGESLMDYNKRLGIK